MPAPTEPVTFPLETADVGDVVEQNRPLVDEDETDPDTGLDAVAAAEPLAWESDPADVLEQRIEIGYDEEHDDVG